MAIGSACSMSITRPRNCPCHAHQPAIATSDDRDHHRHHGLIRPVQDQPGPSWSLVIVPFPSHDRLLWRTPGSLSKQTIMAESIVDSQSVDLMEYPYAPQPPMLPLKAGEHAGCHPDTPRSQRPFDSRHRARGHFWLEQFGNCAADGCCQRPQRFWARFGLHADWYDRGPSSPDFDWLCLCRGIVLAAAGSVCEHDHCFLGHLGNRLYLLAALPRSELAGIR